MAITDPIFSDPAYAAGKTAAAAKTAASTADKNSISKDQFMTLLIAQLKNQDPLNPVQDKDFIAQLATFSQLEQTTTMNTSMQTLIKQQQYANTAYAASMIGKTVTSTDNISGTVSSVAVDDKGVLSLSVGNSAIGMDKIKTIKDPLLF